MNINISPSMRSRLFVTVIIGLLAILVVHIFLSMWLEHSIHATERDKLMGWSTAYTRVLSDPSRYKDDGESLTHQGIKFKALGEDAWAVLINEGKVVWSTNNVSDQFLKAPLQGFDFSNNSSGLFKQAGRGTFSFSNNVNIPHRLVIPVLNSVDDNGVSEHTKSMLVVANSSRDSLDRLEFLNNTLSWVMIFSMFAILMSQALAARWTARPLEKLSRDLIKVKAGEAMRLSGVYPTEVKGVVLSFNELLDREGKQIVDHKNSLDNLAHSLKTPLAVLRSAAENNDIETLRDVIKEQVARMDKQVSYHLSSASRQGRAWLPPTNPVSIEPIAIGLAESLEKIYSNKRAFCEFEGLDNAKISMEEGDIQELLGNLLDNAFKWCKDRVLLSVEDNLDCIVIEVGDNGSGVPQDRIDDIRQRGKRGDERIPGHGIGLAAVDDIVALYKGTMSVGTHHELGGASFKITIPKNGL